MDDVFPAGTERDGFYGMYAFATDTGGIDDDQEFPPRVAHLRFGFDHSGPTISAEPTNGVEGCFDGSRCIRRGYGEADVVAEDLTSGVVEAKCTVDFTTEQLPCKTDHQGFRLGRGQGLHFIDAHLTDNAGNTSSPDYIARWFIDSRRPATPDLKVINHGPQHNGWYRQQPGVSVLATDPKPSSGFAAAPISISVDGSAENCGTTYQPD